ncbi:MAG: DNA polymerase III subunit delta [Bacteroidetes bacterium]|nr:DNA polymerase III subunit delta [Bacteroidota bacterium]
MANSTSIKFDQIVSDIHNRRFTPIYLLEGEETYYIDELSRLLEEKVLKPEEKSFNMTIAYGKDISPLEVKMAARRYPMMSEYQLLIIKEAQNIGDIDILEDYIENPMSTTILVLCYKGKKVDKRKKVGKLFAKYTHFTSDRLRDHEVTPWIERYIKNKGRNIDPKAVQLIADYLGNDLSKVANEIDKMLINVKTDVAIISETHIEQNIGISKDYNVFELGKALGQKNFNKCIQIANYFAVNAKTDGLIPMIGYLYTYFSKVYIYNSLRTKPRKEIAIALGVNEYFLDDYKMAGSNYNQAMLEEIFANLKYYDLRSKGVANGSTEEGQLIIELIVKILRIAEIPAQLRMV